MLAAAMLVVAAGLAYVAYSGYDGWPGAPAPRRAPQLVYTTVDGQLIIPADLQDKVVLVNFWATDCVPCLNEMPHLVETHNKYRSLGLVTIAVAMSYDRPDRILEYFNRNRLPFKVSLDVQGDVARQFGDVSFTPMSFVIDKRGNIVQRFRGEMDFTVLHRLLDQQLAAPA